MPVRGGDRGDLRARLRRRVVVLGHAQRLPRRLRIAAVYRGLLAIVGGDRLVEAAEGSRGIGDQCAADTAVTTTGRTARLGHDSMMRRSPGSRRRAAISA